MTPTRPVLRYHGGKWRLAPWIISHFPEHKVYVEPFGGAASVLMLKQPTHIEVYNDLDEGVTNLFRILRDPEKAERLRQLVELTPFGRSEFVDCWKVADDDIEEARRLIVRSFQAIGNKHRLSQNGWRTRTAKTKWSPATNWSGWPFQIPAFVNRLKEVIIEGKPWQDIIALYDHSETLFYLDPPYLLNTRCKGHRRIYQHEMTDSEHAELLEAICKIKGMAVISGYSSDLYDSCLSGWHRTTKSARAQTNAFRTECLWINPAAIERTQGTLMEVSA